LKQKISKLPGLLQHQRRTMMSDKKDMSTLPRNKKVPNIVKNILKEIYGSTKPQSDMYIYGSSAGQPVGSKTKPGNTKVRTLQDRFERPRKVSAVNWKSDLYIYGSGASPKIGTTINLPKLQSDLLVPRWKGMPIYAQLASDDMLSISDNIKVTPAVKTLKDVLSDIIFDHRAPSPKSDRVMLERLASRRTHRPPTPAEMSDHGGPKITASDTMISIFGADRPSLAGKRVATTKSDLAIGYNLMKPASSYRGKTTSAPKTQPESDSGLSIGLDPTVSPAVKPKSDLSIGYNTIRAASMVIKTTSAPVKSKSDSEISVGGNSRLVNAGVNSDIYLYGTTRLTTAGMKIRPTTAAPKKEPLTDDIDDIVCDVFGICIN